MQTTECIKCDLCGGDETSLCFKVNVENHKHNERFNIVRCKNCGLVYVNPRPKRELILDYYPENNYYAWQLRRNDSLKERLKYMIIEERGGYPSRRHFLLIKWLRRLTSVLLQKHVSVIVPYTDSGRVLDVGCGCGNFLKHLQGFGMDVYGVDISPKATKFASELGLKVFRGELIEAKYPNDFFNTVIVNHVLEHTHDPIGVLNEVNRILKHNGLLIVGVPNIESYCSAVFGKHWSPLQIPRHLYHFSYDTLSASLNKTGFVVEKVVGKSFFIPRTTTNSLRSLKKEVKGSDYIQCLFKVFVWKYIQYAFSRKRNLFGELITVYARKNFGT